MKFQVAEMMVPVNLEMIFDAGYFHKATGLWLKIQKKRIIFRLFKLLCQTKYKVIYATVRNMTCSGTLEFKIFGEIN